MGLLLSINRLQLYSPTRRVFDVSNFYMIVLVWTNDTPIIVSSSEVNARNHIVPN